MDKVSLMLSGGIDSSVLAYWALSEGYDVEALCFDYGQDNLIRELAATNKIAQDTGISLTQFDLSGLRRNFAGLTGSTYRIGSIASGNRECSDTGVGHGIAAEYSILMGRDVLFVGFTKNDTRNREVEKYLNSFSQSIRFLYPTHEFRSEAPFLDKSKSEVIKLGESIGMDFSLTWSCELSGDRVCNKCTSCGDRIQAFEEAGVVDPLNRPLKQG